MKKILYIFFFFNSTFYASAQQMFEFDMLTRQFIDHLQNKQFYEAEEMFNVELEQLISLEQLEDIWKRILLDRGPFINVEEVVFQDMGGMVVSRARTNFSTSPVVIQLSFDENKKIAGIELKPVTSEETYILPDYANRDLYQEEEMFLEVPQGQLPAVFTRPSFVDKFPVVVFIHGTGPYDQDRSSNKPYKDLAIGLATQGIASFWFDKKTAVYPRYFEQIQSNFTVKDEVLEDAASAIEAVRRMDGVNRRQIYILGHSLGGMLAPRIAEENRDVDGIIIMGGNSSPLEDIFLHHVEYLSSFEKITDSKLESVQAMREEIHQLKSLRNDPGATSSNVYLDLPAAYWLDLMNYDQLAVAQDLKEPILVLQGGRDYRVPVEEFELWQRALRNKKNATFIFYPALNHYFIPSVGQPIPIGYSLSGFVPKQVIMDIAEWIKHDK